MAQSPGIPTDLLSILACPQCKGALVAPEDGHQLICNKCHLGYPVKEGIPVMLVQEAKALS